MFRALVVFGVVLALATRGNAQQHKLTAKERKMTPQEYTAHVLRENRRTHVPYIGESGSLSVGEKGFLFREIHVVQIIDENNMLANITTPAHDEILDRYMQKLVWMKVSTSNLVDGQSYNSEQFYKIIETKQYESLLGSKTVAVLEPFTEPQSEVSKHGDLWSWADKNLAPLEARVVDYKNGQVTLRKGKGGMVVYKNGLTGDGKEVTIPLKRFSKEDQAWILKWSKTHKDE